MTPREPVERNGRPLRRRARPDSVSVVVPVYNSEATLPQLVGRLLEALADRSLEIILVDDGSRDRSWQVISELAAGHPEVSGIRLMRNFGQHNATLCGIRAAGHDVIATIDDDLQSPPEEIGRLLAELSEGFDVVYGLAASPQHGLWRGLAGAAVKYSLQLAMRVPGVVETSSLRVFRTGLRAGFEHYDGPYLSIDVLLSWTTQKFSVVEVDHHRRPVGRSQYTAGKLISHALNTITGFSAWPLRVGSIVGFVLTIFGVALLAFVLGRFAVSGGTTVPGFSFLASVIVIFAGAQLFALGIMGEYLARLHFRNMGRPQSVVRTTVGGARRTAGAAR